MGFLDGICYIRGVQILRAFVDGRARHARVEAAATGADTLWLLDGDPISGPAKVTGETLPLAGARLLVPCTPSKIVCVGLNYRAHAREMGKTLPDEPLLFFKPPSALLPTGEPIVRPRAPGAPYERVDFEGELGVVIGRRARAVSVESALSYVFGYTIANDVTVRELQKKDGQFARAKGFDSFCPVGPSITTADALVPQALRLTTTLNGVVRQDTSTEDMVFSVAALIAFVSRVMTLEPGDLLSTGTPPGVANLAPGDVVAITIEGIGTLTNPVIDEPAWP